MKYLKKFENKKKNTDFTFYWTGLSDDRDFVKVIFRVVLEGEPFEDNFDARDWMSDNSDEIFDIGYFTMAFDHVVISFHATDKEPSDIKVVKTIKGRLVFDDDDETETFLNAYDDSKDIPLEPIEKTKEKKKERKEYPSIWLDPYGKRYNVGFAQHNEFAADWLRENDRDAWKKADDSFGKYYYEILEEKGWVRILGWTDPPTFSLPSKIGPKLKKAIKDYCINYGVPLPDGINLG